MLSCCLQTPLHLLPFYITFFQPPVSPTRAFILTFKGTQSTVGSPLPLWRSYRGNLNPKQRLVIKISPAESSGYYISLSANTRQRSNHRYTTERCFILKTWGPQQGGWQALCNLRLDRQVFWVRTLIKMLGKVDEHLFRTMSRCPDLAFDGCLCPIRKSPVPFY